MAPVLAIVQYTPWWVWGLLALLVLLGLQAARPRQTRLRRALVTPLVFVGWGVSGVALHATPGVLAAWLGAAALGGALGWTTTRLDRVRADRARGTVELPGSWLPLARNLAIFAVRYALAVAIARLPAARDQLVLCDLAVSGLTAGYFLGWLVVFVRRYRDTPAAPPPAAIMVPR
jgi:hypothetical protein